MYVQCVMMDALYCAGPSYTKKDAILKSLDDPALREYWAAHLIINDPAFSWGFGVLGSNT